MAISPLSFIGGLAGPASRWITGQASTSPLYGAYPQTYPMRGARNVAKPADLYRVLRAFYYTNGLYDQLAEVLRQQNVWREDLKSLRNPAKRIVEFYPASIWPGDLPTALPIQADNEAIAEPIQQVWKWSNWSAKKQTFVRLMAMLGDGFLKVVSTTDRKAVYFQVIDPEFVCDFDKDERGFVTYIRVDVPQSVRKGDEVTYPTHTEVWDLESGTYRTWIHEHGFDAETKLLGTPTKQQPLSDFGIDFVPFVHAPFLDAGDERGIGAFTLSLDKIREADRSATRLHQMLFRHNAVTWALQANAMDPSGRPIPAPRLEGQTESGSSELVTLGDEPLLRLPGNSSLTALVPSIDYGAALSVLQDHLLDLEKDQPEMAFYRLAEDQGLSGRAIRLMLAPAIARVREARGNSEQALVRADQMALTIGDNLGLFRDLGGSFDDGGFDHGFEERDFLPTDQLEQAQTQQAEAAAVQALVNAGMPLELAVQEVYGWSAERAAQFTKDVAAAIQREQMLAQSDVPPDGGVVTQ